MGRRILQDTDGNENNQDESTCLVSGFDAHPVTFFVLFAAMMVVPFYVLATYVMSKASITTGLILSWSWLVFGAGMSVVVVFDVVNLMGTAGNLLTPLAWFLPSVLVSIFRRKLIYDHVLSQKWLVGLQLFRSIGGVFLIEMARGHLAPIFAYAAGIGDLVVAIDAALMLFRFRNSDRIPAWAVYQLIVVGVLDFMSAFFFGFTSSDNEVQLFYHNAEYSPVAFPVGLIPLFLVPCAIFFHTLSLWTQKEFGAVQDPIYETSECTEIEAPKDDTKRVDACIVSGSGDDKIDTVIP